MEEDLDFEDEDSELVLKDLKIVTSADNKVNLLLPDAFFDDENHSDDNLFAAVQDFYANNLQERDADKAIDDLAVEHSKVYFNSTNELKNSTDPSEYSASIYILLFHLRMY